jgi:hypothetical protein
MANDAGGFQMFKFGFGNVKFVWLNMVGFCKDGCQPV